MYTFGRALQLIGMLMLPIAIAGQANNSMSLGQMLMMTGIGVLVFGAGWMLQQQSGQK